jgi:hypothetical protein
MRFRKKPEVIDALRFSGTPESASKLCDEFGISGAVFQPTLENQNWGSLLIPIPEGDMRASPGDFIIRGVNGEFYPCKSEIFIATYEPAED